MAKGKKNAKPPIGKALVDQVVASADANIPFIIGQDVLTPEQVKATAALAIVAAANEEAEKEADLPLTLSHQPELPGMEVDQPPLELPVASIVQPKGPSIWSRIGEYFGDVAVGFNFIVKASASELKKEALTLGKAIWDILGIVGMFTVVVYAYLWYGIGRAVRFHVKAINHGLAGLEFGKLPNVETVN